MRPLYYYVCCSILLGLVAYALSLSWPLHLIVQVVGLQIVFAIEGRVWKRAVRKHQQQHRAIMTNFLLNLPAHVRHSLARL